MQRAKDSTEKIMTWKFAAGFTRNNLLALALIAISMAATRSAYAQDDVTTSGSATVNSIPLFSTSTNIQSSELSQNASTKTVTASGTLGSVTDIRVDVDGKNAAGSSIFTPALRFGTSTKTEPTGEAVASQRATCTGTGCTNNINGLELVTDFTSRLSITNGGFVGIQTRTPTNVFTILQGAGPAIADGWDTYSSRRFKTNIQTLDGALEKVEKLRGVSYDLKANGKHEVGVIAEEVGEVVPEVVSWDKDRVNAQGVDYGRLTALLIEATKEQQALIHQQQEQIDLLKSELKIVEASMHTTGNGAGLRSASDVSLIGQ
jgi:hypothetical protein